MNILILGSGGREHALAWRLSLDSEVEKVFVMPGNPGMNLSPNIETIGSGDIGDVDTIRSVCTKILPDLVIIGPEVPLANGIVDILKKEKLLVYGPSAASSKLESSKIFAKEFMSRHNIPTAKFVACNDYHQAIKSLNDWNISEGVAIKADSLAAGKGVVVSSDLAQAKDTIYNFMKNPRCAVKSSSILIEEKLQGKELSVFALCDGKNFFTLGAVCDYKRLGNDDTGPNTGGMGCYTPINWPGKKIKQNIEDRVFRPVLDGMKSEGNPFCGTLFAGLMINESLPESEQIKVIEFNVRFGDPESQTLLPLIEGPLAKVLKQCAAESLASSKDIPLKQSSDYAVHVVMASKGYGSTVGGNIEKGHLIHFDQDLSKNSNKNEKIFFAGVQKNNQGIVTSGGRVLGVTGVSSSLDQARKQAYDTLEKISFDGAIFRSDIALLNAAP